MASVAVATGLLLDVVAAAAFGAGRDTDAFVVAARFPLALTAILMLVGNQVLVPTFATWATALEKRRTRRLVTTTLLASVVAGSAVAGLLALAAVPLVAVLAPGFHDRPAPALRRAAAGDGVDDPADRRLRGAAGLAERAPPVRDPGGDDRGAQRGRGRRGRWWCGGDIAILPVAYVAGSVAQLVLMLAYAVARGLRFGIAGARRPRGRRPAPAAGPALGGGHAQPAGPGGGDVRGVLPAARLGHRAALRSPAGPRRRGHGALPLRHGGRAAAPDPRLRAQGPGRRRAARQPGAAADGRRLAAADRPGRGAGAARRPRWSSGWAGSAPRTPGCSGS